MSCSPTIHHQKNQAPSTPTTTNCQQCDAEFTYLLVANPRLYCDKCRIIRKQQGGKAYQSRLRLKPGEAHGLAAQGLDSISRMSQAEAARKVAFWECLEAMLRGDEEVEFKPMSQQAVQQIERQALLKIRKALGPDWEQYKEMMAERGGFAGEKSSC